MPLSWKFCARSGQWGINMEDIISRNRKLIYLKNIGIPNNIIISKVDKVKAGLPLAPHIHSGCFELCCFYSGMQTYAVGSRQYRVWGGDCFFTCPDEQHDTFGTVEEKSGFYYIIFELSPETDFLMLGAEAAAYIYQRFKEAPRIFKGGRNVTKLFDLIFQTYFEQSPLRKGRILALLTEMFYLLTKKLQKSEAITAEMPLEIRRAIDLIEKHPGITLTNQEMARCSGISVSYFKQEFKSATGLTPHDFQLRKKIEIAEQLLTDNRSVTDIAYSLGFSSSQHFATTFKKYKGFSPTDYKRR